MQRPAKIWTIPYSLAVWYCTWKWTLSAFLFFPAEFGLSGEGGVVTPAGQNHFCKQWRKTVGGCGGMLDCFPHHKKGSPEAPPPPLSSSFLLPSFQIQPESIFSKFFYSIELMSCFRGGWAIYARFAKKYMFLMSRDTKIPKKTRTFKKSVTFRFNIACLSKLKLTNSLLPLFFLIFCAVLLHYERGENTELKQAAGLCWAQGGEKKNNN